MSAKKLIALADVRLKPDDGETEPPPSILSRQGHILNYHGPISINGIADLVRDIRSALIEDMQKDIHIYICSGGGDSDAIGLMQSMMESIQLTRKHDSTCTAKIIYYVAGFAYSAAATLVSTGDKCYLLHDSVIMIHSCCIGETNPKDPGLPKELQQLYRSENFLMAKIYAKRGKFSPKAYMKLLNTNLDYFFSGKSAVKAGLVDGVK